MEASRRAQGDYVCPKKKPAYLQCGRQATHLNAGPSDLHYGPPAAPGAPYLL